MKWHYLSGRVLVIERLLTVVWWLLCPWERPLCLFLIEVKQSTCWGGLTWKNLQPEPPKMVLCIGMFGQVQIAWSLRINVDEWLAHLRNEAMHTSLQTKSDQFCINVGPYNGHNQSYLNERSLTFHICIFIQHACCKHFWSLRQHNFKVVTLKNLMQIIRYFWSVVV